jgi:hypothetical protein
MSGVLQGRRAPIVLAGTVPQGSPRGGTRAKKKGCRRERVRSGSLR